MGRWARAKFLASPATGPWLGKDVPGEGPEPAGARRGARRCSAGSCAGAKQRLQRTQDVGRALGGGLGEGTRKGDFESCAGGGGRGEGGGWGRCSEERALTCLCAAAGGGGRGARRGPSARHLLGLRGASARRAEPGLAVGAAHPRGSGQVPFESRERLSRFLGWCGGAVRRPGWELGSGGARGEGGNLCFGRWGAGQKPGQ